MISLYVLNEYLNTSLQVLSVGADVGEVDAGKKVIILAVSEYNFLPKLSHFLRNSCFLRH